MEATKFTEVGYVGRDVDSMVRDLVEASIRITKQAMLEEKYSIADEIVEEKIIEAIIPGQKKAASRSRISGPFDFILRKQRISEPERGVRAATAAERTDRKRRNGYGSCQRAGTSAAAVKDLLEEQYIEIQVTDAPKANTLGSGQ